MYFVFCNINDLIIRTGLYKRYVFVRHSVYLKGSDVVMCRHSGSEIVWLLEGVVTLSAKHGRYCEYFITV